ncbi:MAG: hypothetical protein Q8T09_17825 [Candidatus Melainabacteria bacterium]|nr:hypothetical protein [Candidatus Melainabacteria bacterium]
MVANRPSESVESKSDRLAAMLDNGQGKQVVNQLRHEFETMSPRQYSRMVREIANKEDKSVGVNLKVVMSGKAELVLVDDGQGRANRAMPSRTDTASHPKELFVPKSQAQPLSLADMRQQAIDKDPCARYQDLRFAQLADINRQYAAKAQLSAMGFKHSPIVIDVTAQRRLEAVAQECKLSHRKKP